MKTKFLCLFLIGGVFTLPAAAQSNAFTYQGHLLSNGAAAQGLFDVRFTLFADQASGTAVAGPVTNLNVTVTAGLFTTPVDFGTNIYDGTPYWLELAVRPGGAADPFTALAPRQALTPVPYALHTPKAKLADTAKAVDPAAVDTAALADASVTMAKLATAAVTTDKIADGSVAASDLNLDLLGMTFWRLDGNPGTTPGTHFFGTMDNQPLELKVNGQRVLRLEDNGDSGDADVLPDGAPNVLGGSHGNYISPFTVGATIAGGGATNYGGFNRTNVIRSDFGTIGGGLANRILSSSTASTIAGGLLNRIGTNAQYAAIGGGANNSISTNSSYATVAGGFLNDIGSNALNSVISGGWDNNVAADARYATVAGGFLNNIGTNSSYSAIGGGFNNVVQDFSQYAMIPGGHQNSATTRAFAAGTRAKADHPGSFVWADSQEADFPSTSNNQFNVRASGGVRLETGGTGVTVDGQPVVSGQVSAAQIADGAIGAAKLAAGAVDASRLADGAAATNLRAAGQSGVADGGIILSEQLNAANLLAAGYVKLGTANLDDDTWQPRSIPPPTGRSGHTAVWTGKEMIIWGGSSGGTYLTTGGRYNPATDTWSETRTSPVGRQNHTAVWTGTEMIIWGGTNGGGPLATGSRYNPASNTWRVVSSTNAPSARSSHTAVWTGTVMLLWGGDIGGGQVTNTGGMYDPATDTWTTIPTTGAPNARSGHSAVWTGSQMIIWGGQTTSTDFDTGARYDPASQVWNDTPINNVPIARAGHAAVWTGSEMIVWGGSASGQATDSGGRYNPVTDLWTATSISNSPAPSTNVSAARVWTGTEMIVWTSAMSSNAGGRYNPQEDHWTLLSTNKSPMGRTGHTAVWIGAEMIVWGGTEGGVPQSTGSRFNPSIDGWTATSAKDPGPGDRYDHTAVWTGSEMIVWGGNGGEDPGGRYDPGTDTWRTMRGGSSGLGHSAVWTGAEMIVWGGERGDRNAGRYFPATDTWVDTSPTPDPGGTPPHWQRRYHSAIWTGTEMIVWGGDLAGSSGLRAGYRYQPANDTWNPVPDSGAPSARYGHSAVWTGTDMIIWGGTDGSSPTSYTNSGARYSLANNTWTRITTNNAPTARGFHTAVWTGSEMIVWGGQNRDNPGRQQLPSSGGRYNPLGDFWTPISTNGAPSGRFGHTAVWTGSEMIVWGGDERSGPARSTTGGRYDPASGTWTPTETIGAPITSDNHTAVWTGSGMLVFGGGDPRDYPLNLYSLKRPMYLYLKRN
jgi:N-acetylneuraminic acid mutarotase